MKAPECPKKRWEIRLGYYYYILSVSAFSSETSSLPEVLGVSQLEPRLPPLDQLSNPRSNNGDLPGEQITPKAPVLPPKCLVVQVATQSCLPCLHCLHSLSRGEKNNPKQLISASMSCRRSENKDVILRKYFKVLTFDWGVISHQCSSFWVSGDKAPTCDVENLGYASSCAWFKATREHKGLWHTWEMRSHCPAKQPASLLHFS